MEQVSAETRPLSRSSQNSDQEKIAILTKMITDFIQSNETGKGKPRKEAISFLKNIRTDYQTLSDAYDGILGDIQKILKQMEQFLKPNDTYVPKIMLRLQALQERITLHRESEERIKAEENKRKEAEETLDRERKETVARRPKQKKVSVVPVQAPGSTEKEKVLKAEADQLRQELEAEKQEKQAAAQRAEKKLAHEKRKAERLQKAKEEAEAAAKKAAEELKTREHAPEFTRTDAQKLLDEAEEQRRLTREAQEAAAEDKRLRKEAEKRAADEQKLREETTKRAATLVREAIEQERKKAGEELGHTLQATKSKFADLLADVDKARAEGEEKYQRGRQEGKAEGKMEGSLEMCVYLNQVVGDDHKLRKQLQSKARQLEGPKSVLLLQYMGSDNHDEESIETPPRPQQKFSQNQASVIVANKAELISLLMKMRAELIGKPSSTREEEKNLAITLAMFEYFICNMQLRMNDKSMIKVMGDAYEFISSVGASDCSAIKIQHTFAESEELNFQVLTKELAAETAERLKRNPFGFNGEEAAKVFESYSKEENPDLTKAEKKLRQNFVRAIEAYKIEEWLGQKYAIVNCLVEMYKTEIDAKQKQNIKLAVLLLVAHKNDKTIQEIIDTLGQSTTLSEQLLQAIKPFVVKNERVIGQPLSAAEFGVFAALFQKAKFFVFSDVNVYNFFNNEGRGKHSEQECIKTLLQQTVQQPAQPTRQRAPSGSSATFKPASAKAQPVSSAAPLHTIQSNTTISGPNSGGI